MLVFLELFAFIKNKQTENYKSNKGTANPHSAFVQFRTRCSLCEDSPTGKDLGQQNMG